MRRVIKLENGNLLVECNISEYEDLIANRLLMFDEAKNYNNYIIINNTETKYKLFDKIHIIDGQIKHTDLYQLINNIISNIINDENNLYIHSAVIYKNGNAILLLGDFKTGKTKLCIEAERKGFEILSADQTWIKYNDGLYVNRGSIYMFMNHGYRILDSKVKNARITKIVLLLGLSNQKSVNVYDENNKYIKIKNITKFATWSTNNVLMTNQDELYLNKKIIHSFIKKIEIPIYYVLGNESSIIKYMEENL